MSGTTNKKSLHQKLTEELIWLDSKYGHPPWHNRLIEEVFSSALGKKDKVIDIGCGAGGLSRKLARIVTEGEVVGIEISEEYVERLKQSIEGGESAPKNLVFRLGRAEDIPCPDNYFDHAVCAGSFAFWSEPERDLAEVRRVLKPGGRLYIIDVYEEGPFWASGSEKIFGRLSSYKTNVYSSQEFRGFLQRAGFTEVYQKEVMGTLVTMGTKKPGNESPE